MAHHRTSAFGGFMRRRLDDIHRSISDMQANVDSLSKQMTIKLANRQVCFNGIDIYGCEMLIIMVRHLNGKDVIESFVSAVPAASTTAEVITSAIVKQTKINNLDISNLVSVTFDGASNMSGTHGGVQALLLRISPGLLSVYLQSHALQLALVKAASTVPVV